MVDSFYADTSGMAILLSVLSIFIGLIIYLPGFWGAKRYVMALNAILIGLSTGVLITTRWWPVASIIGLLQAYRIFHALRVVQGRAPQEQLRVRTLRSELVLSSFLVGILLFDSYMLPHIHETAGLAIIVTLQFVSGIVYYQHLRHMLQKTKPRNQ